MLDYMKALHQRFYREPECLTLQEQTEKLRQELKEKLNRQDRKKLLKLVDLCNQLREEASLISFLSGFKLALGFASELGPPYCFEDEEELHACQTTAQKEADIPHCKEICLWRIKYQKPKRWRLGKPVHCWIHSHSRHAHP